MKLEPDFLRVKVPVFWANGPNVAWGDEAAIRSRIEEYGLAAGCTPK